jgi:hypothetical protein
LGYYWTSDRGENGSYLCVSFTVNENKQDERLSIIGLRQVHEEKDKRHGYIVFEVKRTSTHNPSTREYMPAYSSFNLGYLIHVYQENPRTWFNRFTSNKKQ